MVAMAKMQPKTPTIWHRISNVHPLALLVLTLACAALCIAALRSNNEHMAQLKQTVYTADKNGTNVQQALDNLQAYVTAHMNTDLSTGAGSVYPPIQLEYTYLRLAEAQDQAVLSANSGLYTAAQSYCQRLDPTDFSGRNRVPCIEQYVTSHGAALPNIPSALYEFDFVSPTWSPDAAGWSLLVAVLLAILTLGQFMRRYLSRYLAKLSI